jgi:glycerol uptake facilitator-like aquaporin
MTAQSTLQRAGAEALGTGLLLCAVVGSGIMGDRLSGGNVGLALLANSIATGCALYVLILALGPISGAHFNPCVTLATAWRGDLPWRETPAFLVAQVGGAFCGVALAGAMFGGPLFSSSQHARAGAGQMLGEFVACFGLLVVIFGVARRQDGLVAPAVAAYITSAYWFTSSTSFANPAVTLARSATDTFAGIRPSDVPGFILAQALGAAAATAFAQWMFPRRRAG